MSGALNYQVFLKSRPGANGTPSVDNFGYEECAMPGDNLCEGEVLLKTCYLSVDPALRCMMNEDPGVDYLQPWQIGKCIVGSSGLGVVVASRHGDVEPGDLVVAPLGWPWSLFTVVNFTEAKSNQWHKVHRELYGDNVVLSMMSLVAATSLIGLWEKGHIRDGEGQTLVVSGAAGACGSLAGQMGRHLGCSRVVGICGTDEKCSWLTGELGFDAAINYKSQDVSLELSKACPRGVNVYFDNVGGDVSDAVIAKMVRDSHIILCGQISQYNKDLPYPPPLPSSTQTILSSMNITRERFLVLRYSERFPDAVKQFLSWVSEGKIKVQVTMEHGLENTGKAFVSMMTGGNKGKQLVSVSKTTCQQA